MNFVRRLVSTLSRRGPILVDQAISGAGNALPLLLASTRLSAVELVSLSLALLLATTAIGFQRSLLLEPTLSIIGGAEKRWHGPGVGGLFAAGMALATGIIAALVGLASDPASALFVFLAVAAVCLQDFLRYRALHAGRVYRTIGSDSTWLLAAAGLVLLLPPNWEEMLLGWAAGAALGCAWLAFRLPHPRHDNLLGEAWQRGKFQISEMGVSTLLTVVPFFVAAALGFDARVAALRLVQSALGPLNTIHSAVSLSMLIESDRLTSQGVAETISLRNRIRISIVGVSVAYVACVAVFFVVFPVESANVAESIPLAVLLLGAAVIITSAASPSIVLLRAFGRQSWVLWCRLLITAISVPLTAIAVWLAFPILDPASTVILTAALVGLPIWRSAFKRQMGSITR